MTEHPEIDYRDEDHSYTIRATGERLPSVSQIIGQLGTYDDIEKSVLDYAAQRGSMAHLATELYDQGVLDWDSVDPIILPYVNAWQSFRERSGCKILEMERLVYHPHLRYAGRLDRIAEIDGKRCILDIKTSSAFHDIYGIQLAAYCEALGANNVIDKRFVIKLSPDGSWSIREYHRTHIGISYMDIFKKLLDFYRIKQLFKTAKENQ